MVAETGRKKVPEQLTSREARQSIWTILDTFLDQAGVPWEGNNRKFNIPFMKAQLIKDADDQPVKWEVIFHTDPRIFPSMSAIFKSDAENEVPGIATTSFYLKIGRRRQQVQFTPADGTEPIEEYAALVKFVKDQIDIVQQDLQSDQHDG